MLNQKKLLTSAFAVALAATAIAEPLRYSIKPKQVVPYNITITVKTPTTIETMKGVIVYTGKKADDKTLTVEYSGGLNKTTKSTARPSRGRFGGPPRFGGPRGPRGPFDSVPFRGLITTKNTLVMSQAGVVQSMSGDSQLPYVLGNLSQLPFERLPDEEQKEWKQANGFSITTTSDNSRFGPRLPPFFDDNEEKVKGGGGETSTYTIDQEQDNTVTITKTYNMSSPKANEDETGYKMDGSGIWTFNRELGLSESMDFKMNLAIEAKNVTLKYPITVKWNRMPDEAYAAYLKKLEDARAAAVARAKAREAAKPKGPIPPTAMNPTFKRTRLSQLKSPVWQAARGELSKLADSKMTGVVAADMDVLTQIGILRSSKHIEVKALAEKVWDKWKHSFEEHATDEQRAAVARAMGEEPAKKKMAEENPFVVEEEEEDIKGIRTWSDSSGKFKMEAEFVEVKDGTVILKTKEGKTVRIPKSRLSEGDQKLIDRQSE